MAQKKIKSFGLKERISLIDRNDTQYSLRQQCCLLGINKSTLYYKHAGIKEADRILMNLLDEQYTKTPFYGVRKMREYLRSLGYEAGKDHVRTLLRRMGLEAIFPKRFLSKPDKQHKIYPYLLRDKEIQYSNQVWSADITYIRLEYGFAYLVAIIDWYSRYVLSWRLSNTLDAGFCVDAFQEALSKYDVPEIFNTDQGSQFTSNYFIDGLVKSGTSISMDGRGRVFDNIFVERLWRSVKYENIYLYGYQSIPEAREGLKKYFEFYNSERFHQSLGYRTPSQVYYGEFSMEEVRLKTAA